MTPSRAQAFRIVENFPEEHIAILVQNLLNLQSTYMDYREEIHKATAADALNNLQKYRDENIARSKAACQRLLSRAKPGVGSGDYKKDLLEMLEKKYESAY